MNRARARDLGVCGVDAPAVLATLLLAAGLCCGCRGQHDEFARQRASAPDVATVTADLETAPVPSSGDAADDPAIWLHRDNPAASRILGTDKKSGLVVYDLRGRQVQYLARGRLNNVDVRQGVVLGHRPHDFAVATNRTTKSLDVFELNSDGRVRWLAAQQLAFKEPYGVCLHHDGAGRLYAFVNDKSGAFQQWRIAALDDGAIALELVREFAVDSQPEGCVADDARGVLYVGEEERGVWTLPTAPTAEPDLRLVAKVGDALTADVEGLAIYRREAGDRGYLVVSSQGDDSYAVFDLAGAHAHRGSFRIADNPTTGVDGTEDTDGIAVTSVALGATFAEGLLVSQDGSNTAPRSNQNFKLVSWSKVRAALNLQAP